MARTELRVLIHEARALCDVTASLHGVTATSDAVLGSLGTAAIDPHDADDDLDGIDDDTHDFAHEDGPVPGTRSVGC